MCFRVVIPVPLFDKEREITRIAAKSLLFRAVHELLDDKVYIREMAGPRRPKSKSNQDWPGTFTYSRHFKSCFILKT